MIVSLFTLGCVIGAGMVLFYRKNQEKKEHFSQKTEEDCKSIIEKIEAIFAKSKDEKKKRDLEKKKNLKKKQKLDR